jgi:ornithine decarboxylase
MQIGDLVVGHMMGAYTAASASDFNLLKKAKIVLLSSEAFPPPPSRPHASSIDVQKRATAGQP